MIKNLFVLMFSHGRSGSSAVRGYLNLSPDINMAFEENLMILQDTNKKVWSSPDQFSFDNELLKRTLPEEFNGNKIILGPYFVSAERIVEAVNRRTCIVNNNFDYLKVLFLSRDKEDLIKSIAFRRGGDQYLDWARENYEINEKEIQKLKEYFPDHFSFDFYEFLKSFKVRESIFEYLDLSYFPGWNQQKVDTPYGVNYLSTDALLYCSKKSPVKPSTEAIQDADYLEVSSLEKKEKKAVKKLPKKKPKISKPKSSSRSKKKKEDK